MANKKIGCGGFLIDNETIKEENGVLKATGGGGGTTVVANPTLAGTEDPLTGLEVDGTKYFVGGGTSNYNNLTNKPQINGMELIGNKTAEQLGIVASGLSEEVKTALLAIFQKASYAVNNARDYYDALENALYPPVPVVSIEATFNQGQNIVYDDDSLTTLKQYLTVTGIQEDSETIEIENYTLSGTLTVGTSTITVHYGDLTDTFNVTVTERLVPSGYTAYDYLTRRSEAVDYVETQITANPSMAIFDFECWFSAHDLSGNSGLMGNRSTGGAAANTNEFGWYICDAAKNACVRTSTFGTPVQDMGDYIDNTVRHLKYYYNDGDSYVTIDDGSPIAITNAVPRNEITPPQTTYGLWLCNINAMGESAQTSVAKGLGSKYGRIIFYNPGTSVKLYDFIPAYNGTKYGYYERVNNAFCPQKNNVLIGGNY